LLATPEDLSEIAGRPEWDMGDTSYEDVLHLYEDGHRCVLNIMDGEIAGYSWMNPDRIVIPKLGVAFSLNDDELYIYKGFTHERFRGRRLGADRFARWMSEASKFGARRLIVDFAFDNRATTVRIKRLGLTMIGTGTLIGRKSRCIRRYSKGLRERHVDLIDPEFVARNGAA
jgi:GNAT superfamily N-acetyltransferase